MATATPDQYKLCATVHRCLLHKAAQYMMGCCQWCLSISDMICRQRLTATTSVTGVQYNSVVWPSPWLAWRPGTCCLTLLVIRHVHLTVSGAIYKHFFSQST